jgi:DNA transformation protein and related proteins
MDETLEYVLGQMDKLGEVVPRKMFGGIGLYHDGLFFGLIARDVLYFKVDDSNRGDYEERGCEAFRPYEDRPGTMGYHEVPVEVLEDPRQVAKWAKRSVEIARAKPARKRSKSKTAGLTALRNIGPKSAKWLAEVGIEQRGDLERIGAVGAYRAVRESGRNASLNLLYALEGALLDVRWDELPPPLKERLRDAARE